MGLIFGDKRRQVISDQGNLIFSYLSELNMNIEDSEIAKRVFVVIVKNGYSPSFWDFHQSSHPEQPRIRSIDFGENTFDVEINHKNGKREQLLFPKRKKSDGESMLVFLFDKGISPRMHNVVIVGMYLSGGWEKDGSKKSGDFNEKVSKFVKENFRYKTYGELSPSEKATFDSRKRTEEHERLLAIEERNKAENAKKEKELAILSARLAREADEERKRLIAEEKIKNDKLEAKRLAELEEKRKRQIEFEELERRTNLESRTRQEEERARIKAEEEANTRVLRETTEALETRTRIQTEAMEQEARLTAEILAMREKLERQEKDNVKGTIDEVLKAFKRQKPGDK